MKQDTKVAMWSLIIFYLIMNYNNTVGTMSFLNLNILGFQKVYDFGGLVFVIVVGIIAIVIAKSIASRISRGGNQK